MDDRAMEIRVSTLTVNDLPFIRRINEEQGWLMTDSDWHRLLALGGERVLKATVDGEGAGMVGAVPYDRMAYVHSMLVRPHLRRRGVATALLGECLSRLSSVPTVKLDAEEGVEPLYAALGFEEEGRSYRYFGTGRPAKVTASPIGEELEEILEFDREATGVDRSRAIGQLFEDSHIALRVDRPEGRGYLMARPGRGRVDVGPLVATSTDAARDLVTSLMGMVPNHRLRAFVPGHNAGGMAMLEEVGLIRAYRSTRMFLGERTEESSSVYMMLSPEKG